jgi:hypothetical protein
MKLALRYIYIGQDTYKMLTLFMCKSLVTALRSLSNPLPVSNAFIKEVCPSSVLQYVIRLLGDIEKLGDNGPFN